MYISFKEGIGRSNDTSDPMSVIDPLVLREHAQMSGKQGNSALYHLFKEFGVLKTFRKHSMIFSKDDPAEEAYYIESGLLKICQLTYTGQDVTFFIRKSGEYFGIAEIVLQRNHSCYAQCLCDSKIWILSAEIIKDKIKTDPTVSSALLVTMTARLMHEEQTVELLVSKSVSERVAWMISQLYIQSSGGRTSVPILLTHQEMSNIVGCSRQTLSEVFNEWRSRGIIHYTRNRMTILRPDHLTQYLRGSKL